MDADTATLSASLAVPSRYDSSTAPPISIEITNEGESRRRFLGALNRTGPIIAHIPVTRISRLIPAGETTTVSVSDSWTGLPPKEQVGDEKPDVTYCLDFSDGEEAATIRLDDAL